jgi:hypothetical protein
MKRFLFIILTSLTLLPLSEGFGACSIEGKLTPKLAQYESDVSDALNKLKQGKTSKCWPWWLTAPLNKSIELTDRAMLQIPVYGDIVTDFQYNTVMAFRGESRSAVITNGKLFPKIQTKIVSTIDSLASSCNLDIEQQVELVELIRVNYVLESVYKGTAIGTIQSSDGIPEKYREVYDEIIKEYHPKATESCKNEFDFEVSINKALETFSKWTFGIENAWDDWNEAIALFSWRSLRWNYEEKARNLLKRELSRQWMSKNASDIILGNFDCVRKMENWDLSIEDKAKAIAQCKQTPVVGIDKLKNEFNKIINTSKNTEQYMARTLRTNALLDDTVDVNSLYNQYLWEFSNQIKLNEDLTASLINLHIDLLSINKLLEKRIPVMQKNCMKALPDIIGGCRKGG